MQPETWLKQYYFEKYILDVAIATLEHGGVTSKLDTYQFLVPIDAWGVPRYPGLTLIVPPEENITKEIERFIRLNESALREPDAWLGTWIHPLTHCCHLDITSIYPSFEEAKQAAVIRSLQGNRSILAIYNFKHNRTVYLEQDLIINNW